MTPTLRLPDTPADACSLRPNGAPMHSRLRFCLLFGFALSLRAAIGVDATYEQVIAEKGQPSGKMQAGANMVLRYPDSTIRLRAGRVVSVETAKNAPPAASQLPAKPDPTPPPAPAKAASMPAGEKAAWKTNYQTALAEAKEQNRHVFLFFTGSDWCIWCKRLNAEILATPEFKAYAAEKLVLVELDFPKAKAQPAALAAQNNSLAQKFRVRGFPTVVVLNADGKFVNELGYQEGGPGPFLRQLKAL